MEADRRGGQREAGLQTVDPVRESGGADQVPGDQPGRPGIDPCAGDAAGGPAEDDGGQRPAGRCGGVEAGGPPAGVPAGEPSRAAGRPPEPFHPVRLADGHGGCADAAVPVAEGTGAVGFGGFHGRHAGAGAGIGEVPSGPAVGVLLAVRDGLRCDAGPMP